MGRQQFVDQFIGVLLRHGIPMPFFLLHGLYKIIQHRMVKRAEIGWLFGRFRANLGMETVPCKVLERTRAKLLEPACAHCDLFAVKRLGQRIAKCLKGKLHARRIEHPLHARPIYRMFEIVGKQAWQPL